MLGGTGPTGLFPYDCKLYQFEVSPMLNFISDRCHDNSNGLWVPFQNSASNVTIMYKGALTRYSVFSFWYSFSHLPGSCSELECVNIVFPDALEAMKSSYDHGVQCGIQRRNRDLLNWVKKKRRHIRREDLIGYLCGKNAPVRHRSTAPLSRTVNMGKVSSSERSSPRLTNTEIPDDQPEPDLRPFRDALALQSKLCNINNCIVNLLHSLFQWPLQDNKTVGVINLCCYKPFIFWSKYSIYLDCKTASKVGQVKRDL